MNLDDSDSKLFSIFLDRVLKKNPESSRGKTHKHAPVFSN